MLRSSSEQNAGAAVTVTTTGGPANGLSHWCQFNRIRGNEKERPLYTGKNGLWGYLAEINLEPRLMIPVCWACSAGWGNNTSLEASALLAYDSLSWFFSPLPHHLGGKKHMDFVRGAIMRYIEWQRQNTAKHPSNVTLLASWLLTDVSEMIPLETFCLVGWLYQLQLISQPRGKIPFSDQASKFPNPRMKYVLCASHILEPSFTFRTPKWWMNGRWFRGADWLKC